MAGSKYPLHKNKKHLENEQNWPMSFMFVSKGQISAIHQELLEAGLTVVDYEKC